MFFVLVKAEFAIHWKICYESTFCVDHGILRLCFEHIVYKVDVAFLLLKESCNEVNLSLRVSKFWLIFVTEATMCMTPSCMCQTGLFPFSFFWLLWASLSSFFHLVSGKQEHLGKRINFLDFWSFVPFSVEAFKAQNRCWARSWIETS